MSAFVFPSFWRLVFGNISEASVLLAGAAYAMIARQEVIVIATVDGYIVTGR